MRVELYISNKHVDLFGGVEITSEYNFVNFGEIAKRQGAMTVSFDVPKTNNNRDIFENSGNAQSASLVPYSWFNSRLEIDGKDAGLPLCALESVSENYTIRLFGSEQNLGEILNDLQLSDLNLDDLNHHWDNVDIKWCRDNNKPIIYPLLDSTDVSPSYFKNVGYSGLIPPFIDGHYLLEQIFIQSGYSLDNQCKDSGMFSKVTPFIQLGSKDFNRGDSVNQYYGKFTGVAYDASAFSGLGVWSVSYDSIVSQNERYYKLNDPYRNINEVWQATNGTLSFPRTLKIKAKITGALQTALGGSSHSVGIYNGDPTTLTGADLLATIANPGAGLHNFSLDLDFQILGREYAEGFDKTNNTLSIRLYTADPTIIVGCTFTLDITDVQLYDLDEANSLPNARNYDLTATQYTEWNDSIPGGLNAPKSVVDYFDISGCLPDWTQKKFLDNYLLMTCSYLTVDSETNTAIIAPLNQIYGNYSRRLNWSGKVDFSEEPTTEFTFFELAKTNKLLYADTDSDFVRPPLTDASFEINDANLDAEKDAVKLDFLPCETSSLNTIIPSTPVTVCKIPMFKQATLEHIESEPRIVLIKKLNGPFIYQALNTGSSAEDYTITNNVPFAYFIDESQTYSIGFGESLKDEYYSIVEDLANHTKVLTCKMRLNVIDLLEIDNLRPVFIDELNGNFLVLKITKDLASDGLSEVKLLKI